MLQVFELFILLKCTAFGGVYIKGSLQSHSFFPQQFSTGTVDTLGLCSNSNYRGHQYGSYLTGCHYNGPSANWITQRC